MSETQVEQTQQEQTQEQVAQQQQMQQTLEQTLVLTITGEKVHSPKGYRRYLHVGVSGDVDINKCIEWIDRVIPIETLRELKIESSTVLEQTLENIDIIENRQRTISVKLRDDFVEFTLSASTHKHEYDVVLRISKKLFSEKENEFVVYTEVVVDGARRFREETIKYADGGFDTIKPPTIILLKRFAEFLDIISKIMEAYRVLEKIPAKCIYASSLQLNVCKH